MITRHIERYETILLRIFLVASVSWVFFMLADHSVFLISSIETFWSCLIGVHSTLRLKKQEIRIGTHVSMKTWNAIIPSALISLTGKYHAIELYGICVLI